MTHKGEEVCVCWREAVPVLYMACNEVLIDIKTFEQRYGLWEQDMQVAGGTAFQAKGTAYAKALRYKSAWLI